MPSSRGCAMLRRHFVQELPVDKRPVVEPPVRQRTASGELKRLRSRLGSKTPYQSDGDCIPRSGVGLDCIIHELANFP